MGETLQQELSKSLAHQMHYTNKNKIPQKLIHELEIEEDKEIESEADNEILELKRPKLICWNCRKEGHRYFDCLEDRKLFCYGCEAEVIYKPNCIICTANGRRCEMCSSQSSQK